MTTPTNQRDMILLQNLTRETGMTASQIAMKIGVAASTLTRVQNGQHRLSVPTIEKLQAHFPTFFGDVDDMVGADRGEYVEVEILPSFAGMGGGGYGDGEPGRALLPRRLIEERLRGAPSDFILIECRGDSMEEAGFFHGDQVIVDKRDNDPTQPGAFALFDGDAYVVKLVERVPHQRGKLRIFSANDRYREYEVSENETRIIGRPAWLGRAL